MVNSLKLRLLAASAIIRSFGSSYLISPPQPTTRVDTNSIPAYSSCTGLKNEIYDWRGQQIRYIATGPEESDRTVLLIHGLFVNADTFRHTLTQLGEAGYRTYALDLLGSGYSSKPLPNSLEAKLLSGENRRFYESNDVNGQCNRVPTVQVLNHLGDLNGCGLQSPIRENVVLGTDSGGRRVVNQINLRHPLKSCYNFYTWADQINDFTHDIIFDGNEKWKDGSPKTTSIIANSKGCVVALQACLDKPEYYNGICTIDPTYREMHESEMKYPRLKKPITRRVQTFLRNNGHGLYNFITKRKGVVGKLLHEPYHNHEAIDDKLLESIVEPLKLPHSSDVVFDELSYSTGPLFEQQLQEINDNPKSTERKPIWVLYGKKDPWLHPKRVESLVTTPFRKNCEPVVDRVIPIDGAGHCPHDERPEEVGKILLNFLESCGSERSC